MFCPHFCASFEAKINGDKEVVMWGTGTPRREFLYSDDLADACIHLLETQDANSLGNQHINVGVGQDISIRELAELIKEIVGYDGEIVQDLTKPDGTLEKLLDVERLNAAGWKASTSLRHGIKHMYDWYLTGAKYLTIFNLHIELFFPTNGILFTNQCKEKWASKPLSAGSNTPKLFIGARRRQIFIYLQFKAPSVVQCNKASNFFLPRRILLPIAVSKHPTILL